MTIYDALYDIAADNHGLITTVQANEAGAANKDLHRYVADGRLNRVGRGVYRIKYWVPTHNDPYAESVALVGEGAYLYGESVIALHNLAPTNPSRIDIAVTRRVRKSLPQGIRLFLENAPTRPVLYDGIPSQPLVEAIRSCKTTMLPDRLRQATENAREAGLINEQEEASLLEELSTL